MLEGIENNGGTALAKGAAERVANDPYIRHLVKLINSNMFPERRAVASLQEALFEQMDLLVTEEEMFSAHWA